MKLIATKEEADELIKLNLLEPNDSTTYVLRLKPDARNNQRTIDVEIDMNTNVNTKVVSNTLNDIEDFYQRIREVFPTKILNEAASRNLRTGNTDKIKSRIKELSKKFNFNDVITAAKFEIENRTRTKELRFMKALPTWLNDEENIISQIENSKDYVTNTTNRNVELF